MQAGRLRYISDVERGEEQQPRDDRAERREKRQKAERDRMKKHGSRLAEIYRNSILKRLKKDRT